MPAGQQPQQPPAPNNNWLVYAAHVCTIIGGFIAFIGIVLAIVLPLTLETDSDQNPPSPPLPLTESPTPAATVDTSNPNTAPTVITASPSTPLESSSTLAAVLERGYLSVGITNQEGFGRKEEGHWVGFEVDVGRAVSAATFGKEAFSEGRDSEPVKFFPVEATDRFILLANGTIDVLLGTTSDTMERSINEVSSS